MAPSASIRLAGARAPAALPRSLPQSRSTTGLLEADDGRQCCCRTRRSGLADRASRATAARSGEPCVNRRTAGRRFISGTRLPWSGGNRTEGPMALRPRLSSGLPFREASAWWEPRHQRAGLLVGSRWPMIGSCPPEIESCLWRILRRFPMAMHRMHLRSENFGRLRSVAARWRRVGARWSKDVAARATAGCPHLGRGLSSYCRKSDVFVVCPRT